MKGLFKMPVTAHPASAGSYLFNSEKVYLPSRPGTARSRAVHALAVAAAVVALSACQNTSAPTSAAPPAASSSPQSAAARLAIDWAALQRSVGSYNAQSRFLQQPGLDQRLRSLLGNQYELALRNLEVAGPLQEERGVYYVTGNRAKMGGIESVAIAMQPASNTVRVWLLHEGREQVLEEQRNAFAWPTDVQNLISNNSQPPKR